MIRTVRTVVAKPGMRSQVVEILKEISQYAATQDIEIRVFTEPWGHTARIHMHSDYDDADTSLGFIEKVTSNPKGEEAIQRLAQLIEGHMEASLLAEE